MAKKIKETPILQGEDAKRFKEQISKPRDRHAAIKEKERILKNYQLLKRRK